MMRYSKPLNNYQQRPENMKKLVLTLILALMVSPLVSAEEVENCQDLQDIDEDLDADYRLTKDIDCSNIENFDPIGDYSPNVDVKNSFEGVFDGQGHIIKNIRIDRPDDSQVGLFSGLLEGAEVKDVKIEDSRVHGDVEVAGIVGRNDHGTVRRSSFSGEVEGNGNVGGIVGWNWGTIGQVFSDGKVEGEDSVGGIAGINFASTIVAGYSLADVNGDEMVGGVAGRNLGVSTTVDKVFAAGKVEGDEKVGGALAEDNSYGASAYWNKETTGQEQSAKGNSWSSENGLTTEQMTGQAAKDNLVGYDWGNTWGEPEEGRYPYLKALQDSGFEAPSNIGSDTCTYDFFGDVQGYSYQNDGVTGEVHVGDGMTQVTNEGSFGFTKTAECGSTATVEYREEGNIMASTQVDLPEDSGEVSSIEIDATDSEGSGETIEVELNPVQYGESAITTLALPINGEIPISQLTDDCPVSEQAYGYEGGGTNTETLNGMRGYALYMDSTRSCTASIETSSVMGELSTALPDNEWTVFSVPRQMSTEELDIGQCSMNGIDDTDLWEITNQGNQPLDEAATLEPEGLYWIRVEGQGCEINLSDDIFETPE